VTFFAVGLGWLFALYGAVVGVVVAIAVYALSRSRWGVGRALLAARTSSSPAPSRTHLYAISYTM
jgi:hypothetical protein